MNPLRRIENLLDSSFRKGLNHSRKGVLGQLLDLSDLRAAELIDSDLLEVGTLLFSSKSSTREHFFSQAPHGVDGLILDFGVASGQSTLALGDFLLSSGQKVVGFDAFEGIRDPWSKTDRPPGSMSRGGVPPQTLLDHPAIELEVGWVEDTLLPFLGKRNQQVSFAHLDMDVFPPTRFALEHLKPRLVSGSVVLFDDYFGFIGWQNHSHKALFEVFSRDEFLCVGISPSQLAIQLL